MSAEFSRRFCLSVDAENYGSQDDQRQRAIQDGVLTVLDDAADRAGLHRACWDRQPQGDGELALLPKVDPEPELRVIDDYVRELRRALARHNQGMLPSSRLRLRLALHYGVAIPANNGFFGQAVVVVSRLCDAKPLKEAMTEAPECNLGVIVSDRLYQETIKQGHTELSPEDMRQVSVREKEFAEKAWIHLPGVNVHRLELPSADQPLDRRSSDKPARPQPDPTMHTEFHGTVHAEHANFGVSY
jgi:class 3 adenylate cyclase